jgi:chemotaxis protein histidine kinase CheA
MPSLKITPTLWNRLKNNQLLGCRKVYYRIHRLGTLLQSHASSPDPPIGLLLLVRFAASDYVIHPTAFQILCKIT